MGEDIETHVFPQSVKLIEIPKTGKFTVFNISNELGTEIGYFEVDIVKDDGKALVNYVEIYEEEQNKGYGGLAYRQLDDLMKERGLNLASEGRFANNNAKKIWERMVREGKAKKYLFGGYHSL